MTKPKIFRAYEFERDEQGKVTKMYWDGDYEIPPKPTKAEQEAQKLREWNELYTNRSEGVSGHGSDSRAREKS